jgi:hypothetical protein
VERGRRWACRSRRPGPGPAFWYLQRKLSSGPIRMGFCRGPRVGPLKSPCRPTQNRSSSPVRPTPLCVGNTCSSPWSNIAAFSDQTTILAPSSSACRVRLRKLSFRRHFLDWMGGVLGRIRESNQVDRLTTATQAVMCARQNRRAQDGEVGLTRLTLVENQSPSGLKNSNLRAV